MPLSSQNLTLEQKILLACLHQAANPDPLTDLLNQGPDWDTLILLCEKQGVLPLLYQAINTTPGDLIPSAALEGLRSRFAAHALHSLQLQKEQRRLIGLLSAASIPVIPFKGPVLAEEVYGDCTLRSFVDLDLLLPVEWAWEGVQILIDQGYDAGFAVPRKRWAGLLKTENHLTLHHCRQERIVEVHWRLFHPMYGLPFPLPQHWAELQDGREGRLTWAETLVVLCAHGTKHGWSQLKWLADIDRLVRNGTAVRWDQALALARRAKSQRALLLGLNLSRQLCATPLGTEVIAKIEKDRVVMQLTENVMDGLFSVRKCPGQAFQGYAFYLKTRDNAGDKFSQVLRWLFYPRLADWQLFRLGDAWHALYFVERPMRMIWKWIIRGT
jgi:hypothetical protein